VNDRHAPAPIPRDSERRSPDAPQAPFREQASEREGTVNARATSEATMLTPIPRVSERRSPDAPQAPFREQASEKAP